MAWYDDQKNTVHVAVYDREKDLRREVEAASRKGWEVQTTAGIGGHINVRRTTARVVTMGFLLGGASRSKDKITVTFTRDPNWLAEIQRGQASATREAAAKTADEKEAKAVKGDAELDRAEETFASRAESAMTLAERNREQTEKEMLAALKDVIGRRQAQLKNLEETVRAMSAAVGAGAAEYRHSLESYTGSRSLHIDRLRTEEALLKAQDELTKAAKEWREANDKKRQSEEELQKKTLDFEAKDSALTERLQARLAAVEGLTPTEI